MDQKRNIPRIPAFAEAAGVDASSVQWTGGFYKERFDVNAETTVGHLQRMFESPEISHVLENFRIAAGEAEGEFSGTVFGDGDFYKWMEAAAYTAVRKRDRKLLAQLEEYIRLIGRAQQPDGYISTKQIIGEREGNGIERGQDINDFEVYNMGHLFTSACVYYRLTGKTDFLQIAEKAAGYLKNLYEEAAKSSEVKTAVCPSHYMGLMDLYRTTGRKEYLDLAKLAVELRDSVKNGLDDNQDRIPLKTHRKIVGHAVRANYLYAGVADLYMETGDSDYREVLESVWKSLTTQKIYITGGCGALYNGASPYGNFMHHQLIHQAYGYEYQLPNVTAYNETCANLGAIFWAWRMFQIHPDASVMDMLERIMLNAALAGVSLDGRRFFYENMLRRAKKLPYELIWGQERTEYILSYCCPPNLCRTIAESSEYAFAQDRCGVWTGLYGDCRGTFTLENGARFTLAESTDYPYDGKIVFSVSESSGKPFTLHVRVPGWVREGTFSAGGKTRALTREDAGRYLSVEVPADQASGASAQVIAELDLSVKPRLTVGNDLIEEDNGHVCVEAGPLVYCIESADVEGTGVGSLADLLVPSDASFAEKRISIGNTPVKALTSEFLAVPRKDSERNALYRDFEPVKPYKVPVQMIPYFAWDNRGRGEMMVWLPLTWR
ncbi:MAG: glycoside hydrolase family 127 protein [Lachnospiraceae bacterium]|jgi:DUF1680 family protein